MQSHRDIIRRATGETARQERRVWRIALVVFLIVLLLIVVSLIYYPGFLISEVKISGIKTISESDVRSIVDRELQGNYFLVLPRRNIFIYPRQSLSLNLRRGLPVLRTVDQKVSGWNQLNLTVSERNSDFLWCRGYLGEDLPAAAKDCYFMDDNGFVYSPAPEFLGQAFDDIYVPFMGDPVGKRYLLTDQLKNIRQITADLVAVTRLSTLGSSTLERAYYGGNDYLTYVFHNSQTNNRFRIYVPFSASTSDFLINFDSAVNSDIFKKNLKAAKNSVDYIDLRYGRKIFYRFK